MNQKDCDKCIAQLVDYADGELSPAESAMVAEHVAACPQCRQTLAALKKSIHLASIIWEAGESDLAHVHVADQSPRRQFRLRRPALIAASILLLLTGSAVWHLLPRGDKSTAPMPHEMTFADLQHKVNRVGVAAQLLAAAEYLSEQPGGREIAQDRFRYIVTAYPETDAATEARSRLQSRSERRI